MTTIEKNIQTNSQSIQRFGEKLRALRTRQGLTAQQLGDMLGVHNSYLLLMETGKRKPSIELLLEISRMFNVSADRLIKDELELG